MPVETGDVPGAAPDPEPLWRPGDQLREGSALWRYLDWLAERGEGPAQAPGTDPAARYQAVWEWSIEQPAAFWETIWRHFDVHATTLYETVLASADMPGARWFPGARLNYAEHVLRTGADHAVALLALSEGEEPREITWGRLRADVAALAASLRGLGVGPGDRVAAFLPNLPETVVALLACAAAGAVWSACGPDFGAAGVVDRFRQLEPTVLIVADGYRYGGKAVDRRDVVARLRAELPSVRHLVHVPYLFPDGPVPDGAGVHHYADLVARPADPLFEQVPFDHPLWVLFSSGTTGLPKGLAQGHGGILLEHYKQLAFHLGAQEGDRFFWYSSTSWMMWNIVVGSLLVGATAVLYDGSPTFGHVGALWQLAERCGITQFGTSAGYLMACRKAGLRPGDEYDLSALRSIGSTGSPLPASGFTWVYEAVGRDIWLGSMSGGTDVCTAFVGGNPLLPVYPGEIQCRALGAAVRAFDEAGRSVVDEVGELVVTVPMPSMPVLFWNDPDGSRYRAAYFDVYPGVWRHGDWCTITPRGGVVIHGRSDSTLNKQGVRMGSADIYEVVERFPEIVESLVLGVELPEGGYWMPLFVHLADGELDDALRDRVKAALRDGLSPRHVPDEILQIPGVPHTRTGKRLEVPVKRLLQGTDPARAVNLATVDDPALVEFFVALARDRAAGTGNRATT